MAKNLAGKLHYHACTRCGIRYDDACSNEAEDGQCLSCRRGEMSAYQYAVLPHPCCRTECRPVRKDEIETYKLRGAATWWICRKCARQFGWNPQEDRHV